jgi:hypothetical protein
MLKITYKYTQHYNYLQLISKQRVFTEFLKMPNWNAWVQRPVGLIKEWSEAHALKGICRVAKWD